MLLRDTNTRQNSSSSLMNKSLLKKYSYLDSIKICSLRISSRTALRIADSRKLSAKVYANMCNVIGLLFWRSHFIPLYHDSFQLYRKRLFSLQGDMTLEKGLRSQHGKGIRRIQLHDSLASPTRSKRTSYNFC